MLNHTVPLNEIFENTAQKYSNKIAVSFAEENLTYGELNQKANELAYWLISKGIKPESSVGVCLRPGVEIIITLLAIQKAGGVYLPINPDFPKERIKSIAKDAAVVLTISQADVMEQLVDELIKPYCYREINFISNINPLDNPGVRNCEENTAYIFYTSGTTGMPKGIAISNASFSYYIRSAISQFGITSDDTTLTIAKFSFSISLFDLMTSIVSGGRLIILPRDEIMDYGRLTNALKQASIVHIGPNLLKGLVIYIKNKYSTYEQFHVLRHVSSGGDIVPAELLEELKTIFAQAEIYVIYGCTEIACMGTHYLVPRNILVEKSYIGRPFNETEIILLNNEGSKAADEEVGEICFSGPGIMKGYLNREELNKNVFIKIDNTTYFKTGDLGRISASGNLEYLGRRDFQIQLRGQRLELIEIESHLRQAPGILEAVISAHSGENGEKRLIAYITLKNENSFSLDAVRAYLRAYLPDYMQPSGWIVLEDMPLNENLKIARKELPEATEQNLVITENYVEPRNETERILAEIWQSVLNIPRVGIKDNFFNIGGNSLSGMNISMLAAEKGIQVSPLLWGKIPTIGGIVESGVVQSLKVEKYMSDDRSFGSLSAIPPFISRFLSDRGSQTPHQWNISRILIAKKHLSFELIEKAFSYLGERHDALRLKFALDFDSCWHAQVLEIATNTIACKQVDLANLSDKKQVKRITEIARATQREINLTNGPIAYLVLFELGEEQPQELFFVVHHFAMDVLSWKIFWLEFELLYQKLEAASDVNISTLPTSFKTWTETLKNHANSLVVEKNIQKWLQQQWSEVSPLPKDLRSEHNVNTNDSAQVVRFALSEWHTKALLSSGTYELNVEHILISSLATALSKWQESKTVYFDRLVHGRNVGLSEFDLSGTLGCIITYAPTLLSIDTWTSVDNILLSVAKQMKQLGDSGASSDLYRYLGSKPELVKRLEELPKSEVLFNYRGQVDDVLERSKIFGETRIIPGSDHNPKGIRQYPLAIVVDIIDHQLEVRCVYSQNIHKKETIEEFCSEFSKKLSIMQGEASKCSCSNVSPISFTN